VWVLNPSKLNQAQGLEAVLTADDLPGRIACYLPFASNQVEAIPERQLADRIASSILAFEPREVNLRMLLQQARFTVHGHSAPIEEVPHADTFLVRIQIPLGIKKEIFERLALCGLRRSTLFPDLDNLAVELERYARKDW